MICKHRTFERHVGHKIICGHNGDHYVLLCEDCLEELVVDEDGTMNLHAHEDHNLSCREFGIVTICVECDDCFEILCSVNCTDACEDNYTTTPGYHDRTFYQNGEAVTFGVVDTGVPEVTPTAEEVEALD